VVGLRIRLQQQPRALEVAVVASGEQRRVPLVGGLVYRRARRDQQLGNQPVALATRVI